MRITHLCDSHILKDNLSYLKKFYLAALLKDLKQFSKKKAVDLVLLTGDLINKGSSSFDKSEDFYQLVENEFILPILSILSLDKSPLIFIPGNHDVNESKIEDIYESGISSFDNFDRIHNYISEDKENFHDGIKRIKTYNEFGKGFYSGTPNSNLNNFESCFYFEIKGEKIDVAAFNSEWRKSQ